MSDVKSVVEDSIAERRPRREAAEKSMLMIQTEDEGAYEEDDTASKRLTRGARAKQSKTIKDSAEVDVSLEREKIALEREKLKVEMEKLAIERQV